MISYGFGIKFLWFQWKQGFQRRCLSGHNGCYLPKMFAYSCMYQSYFPVVGQVAENVPARKVIKTVKNQINIRDLCIICDFFKVTNNSYIRIYFLQPVGCNIAFL